MATIEELENQVRELGSEVEGEKAVTRQVYAQSVRNGDQIGALRCEVATARVDIQDQTSRVDHMVTEVVQGTAMLRSHGLRLEALTRDIGLLRNDVTALRRGQEELHVRLDRQEGKIDALTARIDALEAKVDALEVKVSALEVKVDALTPQVGEIRARQDEMARDIATILAILSRDNPRLA